MSSNEIRAIGIGEVRVGHRTSLAPGIQAIFHQPAKLTIGDYCSIGPGVKFVSDGGDVTLGDWTTLHDGCLVLSSAGVSVGQHGWFGQHSVLDGTGGLTIGNGVRVGMYSQIWSHVAAGEQIEGCTLYGERPVVIEDDVWLVGSCIVASGVTVGRRTIALIASNITKSWPADSVVAGTPAASKPNLSFYKAITLEEKWAMLVSWVESAASEFALRVEAGPMANSMFAWCSVDSSAIGVAFVRDSAVAQSLRAMRPDLTVCCIEDKTYNKRLNSHEHRVLKYLAGNKARFLAIN